MTNPPAEIPTYDEVGGRVVVHTSTLLVAEDDADAWVRYTTNQGHTANIHIIWKKDPTDPESRGESFDRQSHLECVLINWAAGSATASPIQIATLTQGGLLLGMFYQTGNAPVFRLDVQLYLEKSTNV